MQLESIAPGKRVEMKEPTSLKKHCLKTFAKSTGNSFVSIWSSLSRKKYSFYLEIFHYCGRNFTPSLSPETSRCLTSSDWIHYSRHEIQYLLCEVCKLIENRKSDLMNMLTSRMQYIICPFPGNTICSNSFVYSWRESSETKQSSYNLKACFTYHPFELCSPIFSKLLTFQSANFAFMQTLVRLASWGFR